MSEEMTGEYQRFNLTERLQHGILFVTFLLLAFSGWALKYPEMEQAKWWIGIWGGPKNAHIIHVVSGVIMVSDFAWHVLYMAYRILTGKMRFHRDTTIVPMPKDLTDAAQNFKYFLGLSREKPQFGRFTYVHKFDYWAVFWGMGIIGLSGLFLAFPVQSSHLFPRWTLDWIWEVLFIMHGDEALLAIVFIFFFHFYNEHLRFEKFPMSMAWLTGRISLQDMKHEHPLEYEIEYGKKEGGKE